MNFSEYVEYVICSSWKAKERIHTSAQSSFLSQPRSCVLLSNIAHIVRTIFLTPYKVSVSCRLLVSICWKNQKWAVTFILWYFLLVGLDQYMKIHWIQKSKLHNCPQFHFNGKSVCSYQGRCFGSKLYKLNWQYPVLLLNFTSDFSSSQNKRLVQSWHSKSELPCFKYCIVHLYILK